MNPCEYLSVLNGGTGSGMLTANLLLSGADNKVLSWCFENVLAGCSAEGKTLVVVDDANLLDASAHALLGQAGFSLRNLLSGNTCLYDPFRYGSLIGMTSLRQIIEAMELDEEKKLTVIAYLNLISQIEMLLNVDSAALNIPKLMLNYGAAFMVQSKIGELRKKGLIDEEQQTCMLARYEESSSVAPVLENILFALYPFANSEREKLCPERGSALVAPLHLLDGDKNLKNAVLSLLRFGLNELDLSKIHILIIDKGYGDRTALSGFIEKAPAASTTLISKDVFTLGEGALETVFNRFELRLFSRHSVPDSCVELERTLGEALVARNSYASHHDRHWAANKPLDVLFGRNKTEVYTKLAPSYEAKYRREFISSLPEGTAIIEYNGNSSIVSCG